MKYRYIATKIWGDSYFLSLAPKEKLLFLYLLQNKNVNKVGIYELHDQYILFETGLSADELKKIKEKFTKDKKALFYKNWIYLLNFQKHNKFSPVDIVLKSFVAEFNSIPAEIQTHFFKLQPYQIPENYKQYLKIKKKKQANMLWLYVMVIVMGVVPRIVSRVEPRVEPRVGNREELDVDEVDEEIKKWKRQNKH